MINKRKLKVMLSTVVAAATLVTCSMSAFAAATYTTTTTYNGDGTINVSSTVSGLDSATEEVTYLVFKGYVPDADNIVYIDQGAASGNQKTFSFNTYSDDIGATVKFGAATTTTFNPNAASDSSIQNPGAATPGTGNTITVNIIGDGKVAAFGQQVSNGGTVLTSASNVVFTVDPGVNCTVSGNGATSTTGTVSRVGRYISVTGLSAGATTVEITFTSINVSNANISTGTTPQRVKAATDKNYITTFGTIDFGDSTAEYGILMSKTITAIQCVDDSVGSTTAAQLFDSAVSYNKDNAFSASAAYKFKALGKGTNGAFAVKLVDGGKNIIDDASPYYVRTYVKTSTGVKYGAVVTVN